MLIRLDAGDDGRDLSLRADHECGAVNAHILAAVETLFLQHIKSLGYAFIFIGQQRVRQVVFFLELFLGGRFIAGNTQHYCTGALNLLECVAEPARFYRSTRRVGFGKEEQNQVFATIIFERNFLAVLIGKGELRRFIINLHRISVFKDNNEFIY
jgi:hypothetical protein